MADPIVVSGVTTWTSKGRLTTTWSNMTITTTGDVGTPEGHYPGMNVLSVYVTGTMTSGSVLEFQESMGATMTFKASQTVCGTAMSFNSSTGTGLGTGVVYLVRPGAKVFKPKITAGVSGAEDLTVVFVQSR